MVRTARRRRQVIENIAPVKVVRLGQVRLNRSIFITVNLNLGSPQVQGSRGQCPLENQKSEETLTRPSKTRDFQKKSSHISITSGSSNFPE